MTGNAWLEWSGLPDLWRLARRSARYFLYFLRGALITGAGALAAFGPPQDADEIVITAQRMIHDKVERDGETFNRTMLIGNVRIEGKDFKMRSDRAVLWQPAGVGGTDFAEMYAEGTIRYTYAGGELRAAQLYYDRKTDRIAARDLRVRTRDAKTGADTYLRAAEAWEEEKGKFQLRGILATPCEYEEPHLDVYVDEGVLTGQTKKETLADFEFFPYDTYTIDAYDVTPRYETFPYFYVPFLTYTKGEETIVRELKVGRSSRFGLFVESALGVDISHEEFDTINPAGPSAPHLQKEKWGEILLELDYRTKRGFAGGLDVNYESDDYFGSLDTYFLDDEGPSSSVPFDRRFSAHGGRGRVKFYNRWNIDPHWRLETEASYLSDEDLLEEFFEKEFKEGKEQETTVYARRLDGNMGAFAQARVRVNDFQTQTEYLPRASFFWTGQPIPIEGWLDALTFNFQSELGNLRTRTDRRSDAPEDRTWRWDNLFIANLPIDVEDVTLMPFAGGRLTAYERNLTGDGDVRAILTLGAQARMQMHRLFDVHNDDLNFHGLRHVMKYGAGIAGNVVANTPRGDFFLHDAVDAIHLFDELFVETEHRLETKVRFSGGSERVVTFLRAKATAEFYPSGRRDTTSLNLNNFLSPFHWVPVSPTADGRFRERDFSNVHWELEVTPLNHVSFRMSGEFDPELAQEEFRFAGLRVVPFEPETLPDVAPALQPQPLLIFDLTNSYVRGVTNTYGFGTRLHPTEKWTFDARTSYDTRTEEFLNYSLFLERDIHDVVLRLGYLRNVGRDENIFAVELVPKSLQSLLSGGQAPVLGQTFSFGADEE